MKVSLSDEGAEPHGLRVTTTGRIAVHRSSGGQGPSGAGLAGLEVPPDQWCHVAHESRQEAHWPPLAQLLTARCVAAWTPEPRAPKGADTSLSGAAQGCDLSRPLRGSLCHKATKHHKLPESCGKVARHTSWKVIPTDPGELWSCPRVAPRLSNTCSNRRASAPNWPKLPKAWPTLANTDQQLANIGDN